MRILILTLILLLITACSFKEKFVAKDASIIASLYMKYNIYDLNLDSIESSKLIINNKRFNTENSLLAHYRINTSDWEVLKTEIRNDEIESITRIGNDFLFITESFNGSFMGYWKTDKNPKIRTNLDAISFGNYVITSSKKMENGIFEVNGSW
ncbi:hypothetical protein EZL74_10760 [Flavobacterium silvisoli]|uniref:Lipoprotein n=1 Tax=Flavobacterium silvisoli TaxID=2529433 RepID=A0A4Q9YV88_9FLAO|nr:hypothetical protein [Flavobacterium silvisoli]TBX66655.1 hypothetical protein EZL74_10760 [Flavobacterium silvisoli]